MFRENLQIKDVCYIDILVTSRNGDKKNHDIYQKNK